MKRHILNTICSLCAVMNLWFGLSFAEIISQNTRPNPSYSEHNAIILFLSNAE